VKFCVKMGHKHIYKLRIKYSGQGQRIFPLSSESRPALRPTQPPVQWVPGVQRGRGRDASAEVVNE
jgi:hypothetical protein